MMVAGILIMGLASYLLVGWAITMWALRKAERMGYDVVQMSGVRRKNAERYMLMFSVYLMLMWPAFVLMMAIPIIAHLLK